MQTFTAPRTFKKNARYFQDRKGALAKLHPGFIDEPIRDVISGFNMLAHCFTLQSCHGHFVCAKEQDPRSIAPVPRGYGGPVRYRIAYIALCLQNSDRGRTLREALSRIPAVAPSDVQFGSADWFWGRWDNSYVLQAAPIAHQQKDEIILAPAEAHHIQKVRDLFFREIRTRLAAEHNEPGPA